jgi:hypothetical protein
MIPSNIRKFIFHDLRSVEGYIDPPDALVYLSILEHQRKHGLEGGVAEIGVYFGRSYFLLKRISSPNDRVLVVGDSAELSLSLNQASLSEPQRAEDARPIAAKGTAG